MQLVWLFDVRAGMMCGQGCCEAKPVRWSPCRVEEARSGVAYADVNKKKAVIFNQSAH